MSRLSYFAMLAVLLVYLPGCGGSSGPAEFQGAPPVSADDEQAAADYEKQMQEDFKKNYGTN